MKWPDARGWVGIGLFFLTCMVLWMLVAFPDLRRDEYFKTLATAIVLTGFINGVVSWAYSATKTGGELAQANADLVAKQAGNASGAPLPVTVTNPDSDPVPVAPPKE
jgi:hypothetical protein